MIKINVKEENKEELSLKNRDVILLKDKESGGADFGFIICVGEKWDVLMLEESESKTSSGIFKWNSSGYNSLEKLIENITENYTIKKLEPEDYEININIK